MKKLRRTASLLLAIAMVFALSVTAFATDAGPDTAKDTGSITINQAKPGNTYTIYKLFDLKVNTDKTAFSYTVSDKWQAWFADPSAAHKDYVTVENGYVRWKGANDDATVAKFAKEALAYAKTSHIGNDGEKTVAEGAASVTFAGLPLGYYLVDSPMGALCVLDSNHDIVNIDEKNPEPTIDKKVQEDSNSQWTPANDAQIGDTVNFQTTVHAQPGAENYVVHDKMSAGLTLDENSIAIAGLTKGNEYTVQTTGLDDGCTFEITFTKSYLDTIQSAKDIIITYSATLNEKAVIAGEGNINETHLSYGDSSSTAVDQTTTKTYQFDLVKTDKDKKVLKGAEFKLYNVQEGGNPILLVDITGAPDTSGKKIYRVAAKGEAGAVEVIQAGQATIQGLDGNTTYYLEETKAPDGYNKLKDRHPVPLKEANLDATADAGVYTSGGIQVVNQTGAQLPSTGGIGTTIFYVVGGVMVAAAVILLITKKRMGSAE